jgi:hypothetical protein
MHYALCNTQSNRGGAFNLSFIHLLLPNTFFLVYTHAASQQFTQSSSLPSQGPPCSTRPTRISGAAKTFHSHMHVARAYCICISGFSVFGPPSPLRLCHQACVCLHSATARRLGTGVRVLFSAFFFHRRFRVAVDGVLHPAPVAYVTLCHLSQYVVELALEGLGVCSALLILLYNFIPSTGCAWFNTFPLFVSTAAHRY